MHIGRAEITFFISEVICILFYGLFVEIKPEHEFKSSDMPGFVANKTTAAEYNTWLESQVQSAIHDKYHLF